MADRRSVLTELLEIKKMADNLSPLIKDLEESKENNTGSLNQILANLVTSLRYRVDNLNRIMRKK